MSWRCWRGWRGVCDRLDRGGAGRKAAPGEFTTAVAQYNNRDRPEAIAPEHTVVIKDATNGARSAPCRSFALRRDPR